MKQRIEFYLPPPAGRAARASRRAFEKDRRTIVEDGACELTVTDNPMGAQTQAIGFDDRDGGIQTVGDDQTLAFVIPCTPHETRVQPGTGVELLTALITADSPYSKLNADMLHAGMKLKPFVASLVATASLQRL